MREILRTALSIAGSDSGGGAGILTVPPEFMADQLDAVFTDIFPDAVKIGMVSGAELIRVIAQKLRQYDAQHIVVDPVMVATSGSRLMQEEALETLKRELLPLAEVVTPDIPEAEVLSGMKIRNAHDMGKAARHISEACSCAVLLKGGHDLNDANDLLVQNDTVQWFRGQRIHNPNTHGTGCTLSSAIASNLAYGMDLSDAVRRAKQYISGALAAMLDLGKGSGPMNHLFDLKSEYIKASDLI